MSGRKRMGCEYVKIDLKLETCVIDICQGICICSLRYHLLHPDYLYFRIRELLKSFRLRIVLCFVDVVSSSGFAMLDCLVLCTLTHKLYFSYKDVNSTLWSKKFPSRISRTLLLERKASFDILQNSWLGELSNHRLWFMKLKDLNLSNSQ